MKFRVLGPLEVAPATPSGRLHKLLLAVLLFRANRAVSTDELVDLLWEKGAPRSAVANVRTYVRKLRELLGEAAPKCLETAGSGYLLRVRDGELDAAEFEALLADGRRALPEDRPAVAVERLTRALGLWRGPVLAGLAVPEPLRIETDRLDQLRLAAVEDLVDARLAVGQHCELAAELHALTEQHPLRERLWAQRMTALYRSGRQADALATYQRVRELLDTELGVEPGPELRRLHQRVLTADPGLDPPAPPLAAAPGGPPPPAQLPADVAAFTGRRAELAELDAALPEGPAAAMRIVVLSGTAGVGKTALAVHWARRVADRFPDGQLYVNLRGYDPEQPMPAAEALGRFLRALGVPDQQVAPEADERAARFRTELAGRRMLIVLDNAATPAQVRPLLPGAGTCAVLVTSRDSLAGLVAAHGARRVDVDLLPECDAADLLRRLIGPRAEDPAGETLTALGTLAARCARLPLALRVAAELAAARPATPLRDLVAELADLQQRLDLLDAGGDPRAAVAAVFSWSVQQLPPDEAGAFRLLGMHPGPDFDPHATAALTGTGHREARRTLDLLARAHLLHPTGPGRYGMHDLLRAYALKLGEAADPCAHRLGTVTALFDYYLAAAGTAMNTLYPAEEHYRPPVPDTDVVRPELADPDAARAWLDGELPALVAMAAQAAAHGWPEHAVRLSATLFRYLDSGHYAEALTIHGHARDAARRAGDLAGESHALLGIGAALCQLGRYAAAYEHLERSLRLAIRAGGAIQQARALGGLAVVVGRTGQAKPSTNRYRQALELFQRAGDLSGQVRSLTGLALMELRLGAHADAAEHLTAALILCRRNANSTGEAIVLNNLGALEIRTGRYADAAEHLEQALHVYRRLGNRRGEASALDDLGTVHTRLGRPERATGYYRQALTLFREIGDRDGEIWVHNGLGEAAQAAGRADDALAHHATALAAATETGAGEQQARAHAGLAESHRALGDPASAGAHYVRALACYTDLHAPEADQMRAQLATLTRPRTRSR